MPGNASQIIAPGRTTLASQLKRAGYATGVVGKWHLGLGTGELDSTRVPFIVRWPARVKPGVSSAIVCQIDLLASLSALVGEKLGDGDAPDSVDVLAALTGTSAMGRDHLVEHAGVLSLRRGPWKLIEPGRGPGVFANTNTESGQAREWQLYRLDEDPGETMNVAARDLDKLKEMCDLLLMERHVKDNR